MSMFKFAHALIVEPSISPDVWNKLVCCGHKGGCVCEGNNCRVKVARTIIAKYNPDRFFLSHCSIMAAVDIDEAPVSKSKYKDYLIKPAYSKFINNNGDAWTKKLLAASYRTFIGANNFCEHVQIFSLSKGKVIDAVLREVPIGKDEKGKDITTYYVDILVATDRKHADLVRNIEAGVTNKLSMGCFLESTEITLHDGTKIPIEQVKPGDLVITHTGHVQPVMNVQKRWYKGSIHAIQVEGDYKATYVTTEHPFWGFRKEVTCACGCRETFPVKLSGHASKSQDGLPLIPRYKKGHYARVVNPNLKMYSFEDYAARKNGNPIRGGLKLGWVYAGDLRVGDIVSYPISDFVYATEDATVDKARLLGYFLSEGSYVKDVTVEGEENDFGVRCKICGGIYNLLCTHLPSHGMTVKQYQETYPGSPTKAKMQKQLIRASRHEDLSGMGLVKNRKRIGVEFSLGEHEYDTLNREISELAARVFPGASILRYPKAVKIISTDAAEFFFKHGGEYSEGKRLYEDVLYWPRDVQRHLVATWVLGDLNTTNSKNLADQFRFIFNRLRVHHNIYKVEAREYACDVSKVTADGEVITTHYEGLRAESYQIQINLQGFRVLETELNHAFQYDLPSRYSHLSDQSVTKTAHDWKNSQNLEWMLRPIKKAEEKPYEGWVYNFEVAGDNSYIANDMAVHNCKIAFSICSKCGNVAVDETQACEHVRYEKNNTFTDEMGITRKVAELCGHAEEPESVSFIDASWVANPAFTGAVRRSTVAPPAEIMAKLEKAHEKKDYEYQAGDFLKAAQVAPKDPKTTEEPEAAPSGEPPAETPEEPTEPAAEAPSVVEEPADDFTVLKDKLKKQIMQELNDRIMEEISEEEGGPEGGPKELETLDESLIKPTASNVMKHTWKIAWDKFLEQKTGLDKKNFDKLRFGSYMLLTTNDPTILRNYGYNRRDLIAVMSFVDTMLKNPLEMKLKKAMVKMGGTDNRRPYQVLKDLVWYMGRKLSFDEARRSLAWLGLMDSYPKSKKNGS